MGNEFHSYLTKSHENEKAQLLGFLKRETFPIREALVSMMLLNNSIWFSAVKFNAESQVINSRLYNYCLIKKKIGFKKGEIDVNSRLGPDDSLLPFFLLNQSWALGFFKELPLFEKYTEIYQVKKVEPSMAVFLQCLLNQDLKKAKEIAELQGKHRSGEQEGNFRRILDYLARRDEVGLKEELESICAADEKRPFANYMETFQETFSCRGTSLLRVLRHIGYDISIDHPLIPMDLMPSGEEEEYEVPYFFLEGYKGDLPDYYKKWLVEQGDARDSKKHIQKPSAASSQKKLWNADKYSSETEQWSVEQFRKAGYKVTGNKEAGWEIWEEE